MKRITFCVFLGFGFFSGCSAEEREAITGLYLNYEGAEYESTFIACDTGMVWKVIGDNESNKLISIYKSSNLSEYGELFVKVEGRLLPFDQSEYPNSHYSGQLHIISIIETSTDQATIENCRSAGKNDE